MNASDTSTRTSAADRRQLLRVLVLIAALGIAALGLLAGLAGMAFGLLSYESERLSIITTSLSLLVLTLGLGLAVAWHAWRAIQGKASPTFRPGPIWPLVLLFLASVFFGQAVLSLNLLPIVTFPLLHVAAAALPPLIIVALVGRSLRGGTRWRDVVFQIGSGAFLSTLLAIALEMILFLGIIAVVFIGVAIQPGGQELIQRLAAMLQEPTWLQDPDQLLSIARSPVVVLTALIVMAGIIPVIEEAVKAVNVGLQAYRRPGRAQAFLWGLASGAGFALVEGLLNTTNGLDSWALIILLRVGATLLHCSTGAMMGLAWYQIVGQRRWLRALGLYAASVGLHSLWNFLTVGISLISLQAFAAETTSGTQAFAGLATLGILATLAVLTLAIILGLAALTRYIGRTSAAIGDTQAQPMQSTTKALPAEIPALDGD